MKASTFAAREVCVRRCTERIQWAIKRVSVRLESAEEERMRMHCRLPRTDKVPAIRRDN